MSFSPDYKNYKDAKISDDTMQAMRDLRAVTGNTMDLNIMNIRIGGVECAVVSIEGMTSTDAMSELIFRPIMQLNDKGKTSPQRIFEFLTEESLLAAERKTLFTYGDVIQFLFSGFAVIFTDTIPKAVAYGIQGYDKRSVSAPESEQTIHAAQDSFTETIRTNLSLVRRRMKTPALRFEMSQLGEKTSTDVCIMYLADRASPEIVRRIRTDLSRIKLDTIMTSEYLQPFIDESYENSIFSSVMRSERPDMICTCLNEGKVCILVDGTPFCLILPTVFADNFRTMDDYCQKSFYVTFTRWMRYIAFFLAVAFPGLYVALVMFHPEIFTMELLLNLSASEEATPYPLVLEVIMLMVLFEIMREAGLRLPKAVGGAVSIVGGLIIGDAAVKSGIVSAPLLIVIGITATASFVLPSLYPAISVLRIVFILAGGLGGLFGLSLAIIVLMANVNNMNDFAVSFTAPIMPFCRSSVKDVVSRASFREYEQKHSTIGEYRQTDEPPRKGKDSE